MKRWSPAVLIGFRFVFCYLVLHASTSYLARWVPMYSELWHFVLEWVADLINLGYEVPLETASISDTAYGWMLLLCYLILAAVAAAVWSILDRKRAEYERLHAWLRLWLRASLAFAMFIYGALKLVPAQMISPPPMGVMGSHIGDLFPNHFLWWGVGASPVFESLSGLAELIGGLLLLVPRTTLLGALVCAGDMLFVFLLNVGFDIPVKLGSSHWLFLSLVLIAPDAGRLAGVFLFNRRVEPSRIAPLFRNRWLNRAPHVLLFVYCLRLLYLDFGIALQRYEQLHPPRPPLYGYWSVEEFVKDGRSVPLFTDPGRWRWVSFLKPGRLGVETMIGTMESHDLDPFRLDRKAKDLVILEGQGIRAKLRRMPLIRDVPWPYKP